MPELGPTSTAVADSTPVMGPILPQERIEVLDILRGWAIFGIVLINWLDYRLSSVDHAADRLVEFFVAGKFYTLFSFLFGLGLAIQLGRAEARGVRFVPIYRRRLFILLLIGLAHNFLLWPGDILNQYAVLGFLLLLFRARSLKTLVVGAILSLAIPILVHPLATGELRLRRAEPEAAQTSSLQAEERQVNNQVLWQQSRRAHRQGTYAEMVAQRVRGFVWEHSRVDPYTSYYAAIFAMFLLGLYAGRRGIFQNLPAHLPFIRRVMWWGLGVGVLGNLVNVIGNELSDLNLYSVNEAVRAGGWYVGAPALCFFYASSIILLFQREAWQKRLAPLAYVGRMALSNYLLQTVIFTTIFYNYGLGLPVQNALVIFLAIVVYLMQILLSRWWLGRFQFGPMEWLWRSLTYGKRQPMRLQPVVAAAR